MVIWLGRIHGDPKEHGPAVFSNTSGSDSTIGLVVSAQHSCRQGGLEFRLRCHVLESGVQGVNLCFVHRSLCSELVVPCLATF